MIKFVEVSGELSVSPETPFGCKIACAAAIYGFHEPFAQFWMQEKLAVAKLDDGAVLDGICPDADELREFLKMLGVASISCEEALAESLGFSVARRGEIMVRHSVPTDLIPAEQAPGIREIYEVMNACESETFPVPEFEPFYMDLFHRMRHGAGLASGVSRNGELAAFALCSAITEPSAVISAVAALPRFRRQGCGSEALSALLAQLKRENTYIFRADGENESFYRSAGFQVAGRWAEMHLL